MDEIKEFLLIECNLGGPPSVRYGGVVTLAGKALWVLRLDASDEIRGSHWF
jgi:hypothetical protein